MQSQAGGPFRAARKSTKRSYESYHFSGAFADSRTFSGSSLPVSRSGFERGSGSVAGRRQHAKARRGACSLDGGQAATAAVWFAVR